MNQRTVQQFDFGANWKAFSERALTPARVRQAKKHFSELFSGIELRGRAFLDIGFGQGLTLLIATLQGAKTVGCDINSTCAEVMHNNQQNHFPELAGQAIPTVIGSILDEPVVSLLRKRSPQPEGETYDVVHAWGVLHHTGDMRRAIRNAASLVGREGHLVLAIYNRDWSSGAWRTIKRFYNASPAWIQRVLVKILYPVVYLAKWSVMRTNPLEQSRGMDFYFDLRDWIGGYPYEYATADEIEVIVNALGFQLERFMPTIVPTGCNQFVFKRISTGVHRTD
jgi:2-polyprenyl-6-hydroxyphenyl methylase/3-demethylubiquinone-9 3-methyltransferase